MLVDDKHMNHHIIDIFPSETEFYFIYNDIQLETTNMHTI
jgi:hypothetical protein